MAEKPAGWVDFAEVRKVPFVDVLEHIGALRQLERRGEEVKGVCPLCGKGEGKESFSVNVPKNVFVCHACKKKGNVLDFARFWLQKGDNPQADLKAGAAWLAKLQQRERTASEAEPGAGDKELRAHVDAVVEAFVSGLERRLEKRETLVRDLTDLLLGVLEVFRHKRVDT